MNGESSGRMWPIVVLSVIVALAVGGTSLFVSRDIIASDIKSGKPTAQKREQARQDQKRVDTRLESLTKLLGTLKDSLVVYPDDSMLVISTANISYDLGKFAEAVGYYQHFLERVDPLNTAVRIDFAYALFQTGQQEQGIAELKRVIERQPKNQTALINLAVMFAQRRQFDEAKKWFIRCRDIDPKSDIGRRAAGAVQQLETQT